MGDCVAPGCTNRSGSKKSGITFHAFPKNEQRRRLWIIAVRRKNWVPTPHSRLCSEHFTEDMIDRTSLTTVRLRHEGGLLIYLHGLRENAVPTIFAFKRRRLGGHCFIPGCDTGYLKRRKLNKLQGKKNPSMFSCPRLNSSVIMPSHCFVPGCQTNYPKTRKRNRLLGKKNPSAFRAPKDPKELENWRKVIPRPDKLITPRDCVCEFHFTEDDICRYYETTVFDGTKYVLDRLERGVPKLKKGAIPTIFPNLPNYSKNLGKIVKKMKLANQSVDKPHPVTPKTIEMYQPEVEENSPSEREVEMCCAVQIKQEESSLSENEVEMSSAIQIKEQENFTFNELVQNLNWISKPNALWGITSHDTFVMCAKWDENYTLKKRVIIDRDLKIKVYLQDADFTAENADVKSFEEISCLLDTVDECQLSS